MQQAFPAFTKLTTLFCAPDQDERQKLGMHDTYLSTKLIIDHYVLLMADANNLMISEVGSA